MADGLPRSNGRGAALPRKDGRSARDPGLWEYGQYDMVSSMKTTVEIPDSLAEEARQVAAREQTTLRALIEAGLRTVIRQRRRRKRFRLRDASFGGRGLQPDFRDASWERIREAAYEGRGG